LGRHDAAKQQQQQRKTKQFRLADTFLKKNKTNFVREAQVSEINNFDTVIFAVEKFLAAAHKLANSTMYLDNLATKRRNDEQRKNTTS
jgi:hypothetical protein